MIDFATVLVSALYPPTARTPAGILLQSVRLLSMYPSGGGHQCAVGGPVSDESGAAGRRLPGQPGQVKQRRGYVRVAVSKPVSITTLDGSTDGEIQDTGPTDSAVNSSGTEPAVPLRGFIVDLSERAARCSLFVDADTVRERLTPGCGVLVEFALTRHQFRLPAKVGRLLKRGADEPVELIVHFDRPVIGAKALRQELFAEQIRQRYMTG